MAKDLIIVESPAKTRTLSRFLGKDYVIKASMGHVRDLPKSRLGVKIEEGFEPSYTVMKDRRQVLNELKKAVKAADNVYLATDPDREGEAIAWHLQEALKLENPLRIEFNEITETAVQEALTRPHSVNMDRVNAQQARRILDRLVGYQVSPLLWKRVARNLSAGRVQSVALRMVVEREREIEGFVPREYWSLAAQLTPSGQEAAFEARLVKIGDEDAEIPDREAMLDLLGRLGHRLVEVPPEESADEESEEKPRATFAGQPDSGLTPDPPLQWRIASVTERAERRNAPAPFITSSLQMEASRKLGFSARRTMSAAQRLYEGIDIPGEGPVGLITYMRTDSTRLSAEAQAMAHGYIEERYGSVYHREGQRRDRAVAGAQDAHEAVRPTNVRRAPDDLREHLETDELRLYTLIWQRFLASQMAPARFRVTTVEIPVLDLLFRATGREMVFDGFRRVYEEARDEDASEEAARTLPPLAEGDELDLQEMLPKQHFTTPPPRYSEATLVRAMEEHGIGRPSTYAQTLSTLMDRKYVDLQKRRFHPTPLGCTVTDQLVRHFPTIFNVVFTAKIEEQLDKVTAGERDWVSVLSDFYVPFQAALERADKEMEDLRPKPVVTDIDCSECAQKMLIRTGRTGRFLGCSGYPECKKTAELPLELMTDEERAEVEAAGEAPPCPECGAEMVRRHGRYGIFYGCSRYPECKTIYDPKRKKVPQEEQVSLPCPRPECEGAVVGKMSRRGKVFWGCDAYPKCDFVAWDKPTEEPCETCGYPMGQWVSRGEPKGLRCTNMDCPTNAERKKRAPKRRSRGRRSAASGARSG